MDIEGTVFRTTMHFKLGGSEIAQFGLHARWENENPVTPAVVQSLAEKYRDAWNDEVSDSKSGFCSSVVADYVRVAQLNVTPGQQFLKELGVTGEAGFSGPNAWQGSNASSLPWETSMCVNYAAYEVGQHVLRAGRRRGRFYLPPMSPDSVAGTEGQFTNPLMNVVLADLKGWIDAMQTPFSGGLYRHVVISRGGTKAPIDAPGMYDVNHLFTDSIVDSQRRRRNREVPALTKTAVLAT